MREPAKEVVKGRKETASLFETDRENGEETKERGQRS